MSPDEITTIPNYHVQECGNPPAVDHDDYTRVSYFQNSMGEQLLFLFDADRMGVKVHHGDVGWEDPLSIPLQNLEGMTANEAVAIWGQLLSDDEQLWLDACFEAIQLHL